MSKITLKDVLGAFFIPLLILVFCGAVSYFVLIPKISQVLDFRKEITVQKERITKLSEKLTTLDSYSETELLELSNLLLEAIPNEKNFYLLLSQSKEAFKQSNVSFGKFSLSPGLVSSTSASTTQAKKDDKDDSTVSLGVAFSSSFEALLNLIQKTEKSVPFLQLANLRLGTITPASSSATFDLVGDLSIENYFRPLPKTLGTIETPLPKLSEADKKLLGEIKNWQRFQFEEGAVSSEEVSGRENPFSF